MAKHYKSQVSSQQMAKRDLLQLTLICITLVLFWKRERRKYPAVTVRSDSRTPSARELTFYNNVNNSWLKPLFTLVHICVNNTHNGRMQITVTHISFGSGLHSFLPPVPEGHCLLWWYYLDNWIPGPFSLLYFHILWKLMRFTDSAYCFYFIKINK